MKKTKDVIASHPEYAKLIRSTIKQLGSKDCIEYVTKHGASGGYSGFIYYNDTCPFAYRNRKDIISLLTRDAEEAGENILTLVQSFNGWPKYDKSQKEKAKWDAENVSELVSFLAGKKSEEMMVTNLMAWYALETVCSWFCEE